ncbi:MAG: ABC transporter ATP-binding protein, partial [Proteobacteria bacterium]|nr:ABC transporter ATP-binding protein [Pseudomonadota bacterium]
ALVVSHDRDFLDRVATMIVMSEGEGRFSVYAGGYSDMVAQRGQGVAKPAARPQAKSEDKKPASARPPREAIAKLSFSDQHALKTLPDQIEVQNKQIAALQKELSDPKLYASNAARFTMLSAQLAELAVKRDANEELWLALEMKREALES